MRQICLINGSPKSNEGASYNILNYILRKLETTYDQKNIIHAYQLLNSPNSNKEDLFIQILSSHIIVVVFPLYVDCLPSHLLEMLANLHTYKQNYKISSNEPCYFYGVVNCGFLEGEHNIHALKILEHYATQAGFKWHGGLGLGGCGSGMPELAKGNLPQSSPIGHALYTLIDSLLHIKALPNKDSIILASYPYPKWLFILACDLFWIMGAKKNKVTYRILFKKPYL